MPPRPTSSSKSPKTIGPTEEELGSINEYLALKPDFEKLIREAKANKQPESLRKESEYDRVLREAVKQTSEERRIQAIQIKMPVHPKEEEAGSNLTDQVAKESKDSTASTHPMHSNDGVASMEHHKANPGPVIADNIGQPASKEELKKRAEELNKK